MQGVLDPLLRQLLTSINEYDLCVSEFVRVVDSLLPAKVYHRLCPELHHNGKTLSGTPVRVQLLGQHPQWLAENAQRTIELGSSGIDLNCGCPSKTVNGSMGGASLLKDPELIYRATKAIREAVPQDQIVSVKVRLGWDDYSQSFDIADAVQQGGANEIAIHGRTKKDGYKADKINWQAIGDIQQRLTIPVIANGEIIDYQSAKSCKNITACDRLMVGRGALNIPNLSKVIKYDEEKLAWHDVLRLLEQYLNMENPFDSGFYHTSRTKQWLKSLMKEYDQAKLLFEQVKVHQEPESVKVCVNQALLSVTSG
ncbi:Probable tRNA-dihydrouridine synthase [Phocoenobacter uteri]|uniref:tRNA-dihydrouridine(16) synthase n=2 Tax=Phocoenobacter uteri TaxID=146806 RepID=A0A379C715_9PAST|nr:tRNA dihydrouridine synthase DusC [Phocoenobacter uteri]SUB58074.1 Probable tRNA-dihydrouridine synthase [Phocoenobacter uteri]